MAAERIPVYLLTGFLGSGKTTLLNAALRDPALAHTAVVVNELGDIGLDQIAVAQSSDNVVLLDAGCLCCINPGALHETLADLIARRARREIPPFERVIIETSGAADPAPLLHVLLGHPLVTPDYRLAAVVCTVDAQHFLSTRQAEAHKQVAMADRIVVTKRDLADPAPVLSFLLESAPEAEITDHPFTGDAKPKGRLGALGPLQPHGRPGGIRAYSFRPRAVTWASWAAWSRLVAERFGARLLRVKGLLQMQDTGEIALVHGVQGVFHKPQRFRDWPDADHGNRLVCISRDLEISDLSDSFQFLNSQSETQA
jgi:G3E family GTPase